MLPLRRSCISFSSGAPRTTGHFFLLCEFDSASRSLTGGPFRTSPGSKGANPGIFPPTFRSPTISLPPPPFFLEMCFTWNFFLSPLFKIFFLEETYFPSKSSLSSSSESLRKVKRSLPRTLEPSLCSFECARVSRVFFLTFSSVTRLSSPSAKLVFLGVVFFRFLPRGYLPFSFDPEFFSLIQFCTFLGLYLFFQGD